MPAKMSVGSVPHVVKTDPLAGHDAQIFAATKDYIDRGWSVLPFDRTDGICHLSKEQATDFKCSVGDVEQKFYGFDVGIDVAASGLVDLDVDCAEAVPFINWLLPKTTTMGRPAKPVSHLLFKTADDIKYGKFTDIDGKELLAIMPNLRLALPPSPHRKTGTPLGWTVDCDPAKVPDAFNEIVGQIAALSLITRLWPGSGNHHNATLALAGTLVRAHWPLAKAGHAITLIANATGDPKVEERLEEVKSTYERFGKGETDITGLPRLAEEFAYAKAYGKAKDIELRLRDWLSLVADPAVGTTVDSVHSHIFWGESINAIPLVPVEHAVTPLFQMGAIHGVYAEKSGGKTFLALELGLSVALGKPFLKWQVPKPRRVLYVDGEMPLAEMREQRLKLMIKNLPATFGLLSADHLRSLDINVNIASEQTRDAISAVVKAAEAAGKPVEVLILDNLFSLAFGVDLNSALDYDPIREWLLALKAKGLCIVMLDHENKAGSLFGTVSKFVNAAVILHIKKREFASNLNCTSISIEAEWARSFPASQARLVCEFGKWKTLHGEMIRWDWGAATDVAGNTPSHILTLYHIHKSHPKTAKDVKSLTGASSRSTVQLHLKKLRDSGFLSGLTVTKEGMLVVKTHFPGLDAGKDL